MPEQTNKKRLVKNSVLLLSAEAISKLTALLIQIIAARHLGSKGYGMFSYAFVGTGVLLNFVDHGFRVYITREIANDFTQSQKYIKKYNFPEKNYNYYFNSYHFRTAYTVIPLDSERSTSYFFDFYCNDR